MVTASLGSREGPSDVVRRHASVTIADGQSLSGALPVDKARWAFVQTPSGWDAAAVTMEASIDGNTFASLRSMSAEQTTGSITGAGVAGPFDIGGAQSIKVRSGTAGAAVNQTGDAVVLVTLLD